MTELKSLNMSQVWMSIWNQISIKTAGLFQELGSANTDKFLWLCKMYSKILQLTLVKATYMKTNKLYKNMKFSKQKE